MKGECQSCGEEYFVSGFWGCFCSERCARKWEEAAKEAAWEDVRKERLEEPRPFPSRDDYIDDRENQ